MSLPDLLARIADFSRRHALQVLLGGILVGALSLWAAHARLGITTDTDKLFSSRLPWRQAQLAMNNEFPQFQNLLVAVVQSPIPEVADSTAAALAKRLSTDKARFASVRRPDASPWFRQNAFMFLDSQTLQDLLNRTIDAQPFLGQLVADPSARGLFAALNLVAQGVQRGDADVSSFTPALRGFEQSLGQTLAGRPEPLSWQRLLAGSLADQAGPFKFVLAHPRLDFMQLQAGGAATQAMRAAIASLPYVKSGLATVRITGDVAISDEEFATVAQGAVGGLIGSLLLVAFWLFLGVRSIRLIVPILCTLFLGLALTTGFAAVAVGTINVVSVAFAVLFIGIAVDFSIQFSVRYRSERHRTPDPNRALSNAAHRLGPQILIAAIAISAGFFAFVPTAFAGVAELGLIAGAGMLIAFGCTIFFLPAVLTLCRPRPEPDEVGAMWADHLERWLMPFRGVVLALFAAGGIFGAAMLPSIRFDSDPLHTKNPNTEAMQALRDLMKDPTANPYSADILEPDLAKADAVAGKLRPLPLVSTVLTLSSFVPKNQSEKLPYIQDAENLLGPTLNANPTATPVTPQAIRDAAESAHAALQAALPKVAADSPLRPLTADLGQLVKASDATVMAANTALIRFLPDQIQQLRTALTAKPVTVADVPEDLRRDWMLSDGRARIQAVAKPEARDSAGLRSFSEQIRSVAPNAVGSAVTIVETAATIINAFRTAALSAIVAIALLLLIALRRVIDAALVMTPLMLSALLTVIPVVLVPMPLNFANIIALPLLLGVGVSFNIYFVMNWREGGTFFMGTATARAVTFSALTTGTAFSSLALSAHPGTASMGALLLTSLGCTVLTSLLFVPVLLRGLRHRPGRSW